MSSKTSVETYNKDSFYKKPDRVTPRYNRYKKHQFSTLNPDFVNTNDGTVPSTQSNILAIVNKDGSVKKTIMDSSISLSNDGQFISKGNIATNHSQEHTLKNQWTRTLVCKHSDQDKKNSKSNEKNNLVDINELRKKLTSTKKCRRNKKQIKNLLSSEKKLKTALSKNLLSNTDHEHRSAQTQTDPKNFKYSIDDKKHLGLTRSSEKIQYPNKEVNNTKTYIMEIPTKSNYDESQNKKKLTIIPENLEEKQEKVEHAIKDIETKIINENMSEANKPTNLLMAQSSEGEVFPKFKIVGKNKNIKKIGYLNKICSMFLFVIILCWFLSVVFKMNIPQDLAKIFFRYSSSLPIFTRHKRRELTKAEIGLKWINGVLNVIKRVVGL